MSKESNFESHPAYGQVAFFRTTHGGTGRAMKGTKLYGSRLPYHRTTVVLKIWRSVVEHRLGSDWHFPRKQLIEVELSSAQFAELITNLNQGSGVPCTVRWLPEEGMVENIPHEETSEAQKILTEFDLKMANVKEAAKHAVKEVASLLEARKGKCLRKQDREEILRRIEMWSRLVGDSAPFAQEQFARSAEKTKVSLKAEMEASKALMVQSLGFKALQESPELQAQAAKLLEAPEGSSLAAARSGESRS